MFQEEAHISILATTKNLDPSNQFLVLRNYYFTVKNRKINVEYE
jgi:hypothetical protein